MPFLDHRGFDRHFRLTGFASAPNPMLHFVVKASFCQVALTFKGGADAAQGMRDILAEVKRDRPSACAERICRSNE